MLAEKIGHIEGQTITNTLPANGATPRFETSVQAAGKLYGIDVKMMGTYSAEMNTDGTWYGECPNQGVVMAADGMATFRATGVGRFTEDGGTSFRGVVYFQTSSESLKNLNGTAFCYEWEVDANNEATWDLWEWR